MLIEGRVYHARLPDSYKGGHLLEQSEMKAFPSEGVELQGYLHLDSRIKLGARVSGGMWRLKTLGRMFYRVPDGLKDLVPTDNSVNERQSIRGCGCKGLIGAW